MALGQQMLRLFTKKAQAPVLAPRVQALRALLQLRLDAESLGLLCLSFITSKFKTVCCLCSDLFENQKVVLFVRTIKPKNDLAPAENRTQTLGTRIQCHNH